MELGHQRFFFPDTLSADSYSPAFIKKGFRHPVDVSLVADMADISGGSHQSRS